jgi:hypothetical protein
VPRHKGAVTLSRDYYQALSLSPNLLALSVGAFQVSFGSLADIRRRIGDVRFTPESGHVRPRNRRCVQEQISPGGGIPHPTVGQICS